MRLFSLAEARDLFKTLPANRRMPSLSPDYVVADAVRDPELEPVFIGYSTDGTFWIHGVQRGSIRGTAYADLQSPYGYGQPVDNFEDPALRTAAWSDYISWCRDNQAVAEFVRLHPLCSASMPYPGCIRRDRDCVAIPVGEASFRSAYRKVLRYGLRKAETDGAKVVIYPAEMIASHFGQFYRQGMRMIGATDFYMFGDRYFESMARLPGIRLQVCELEGTWLAACLLLTEERVWEYHLSATSEAGRSIAATSMLIDRAATDARAAGAAWVFLGGGTTAAPDNPLLFFKSGFAKAQSTFNIGYHVHIPDIYTDLKQKFPFQANTSRILFYRA